MPSANTYAPRLGACVREPSDLDACPAPSCFLCPHYRTEDPETLADAHVHERARIHDALDAAGRRGLTLAELIRRTNLRPVVVSDRLRELLAEGAVRRRRARRRTAAGGHARVYVLPWGGQ